MYDFISLKYNYYALNIENGYYFVFHSFNGEPFILDEENFKLLQKDSLLIENIDYDDTVTKKCLQKTDEYISNYCCPHVLDFIISEKCNLGCHMCFHATSLSHCDIRKQKPELSTELALRWLDYYIGLVKKYDLEGRETAKTPYISAQSRINCSQKACKNGLFFVSCYLCP